MSTRTSEDAAAAIGCSVAEIAKSLVFKSASGKSVLVIASGSNRVDEKKVRALLGEKIERADADFVRSATGYAIGGVPPLAHATQPVVLIDRDLEAFTFRVGGGWHAQRGVSHHAGRSGAPHARTGCRYRAALIE